MDAVAQTRPRRRRRLLSTTERLLQDGRVIDEPTEDERAELRRLQDLGLIAVSWRKYFLCIDHNDDTDLLHAWKRACPQKIELTTSGSDDEDIQHEDDLQYVCEECGRAHWPIRRHRSLYPRAVVTMTAAAVEAFFDACVREIDPDAERLHGGPAFRVRVDGRAVHACLLDECTDTPYATRSFASVQPIVFVTAAPRIYTDRLPGGDDWLEPLALHDLARAGSRALRERLATQGSLPYPRTIAETQARVHLPLRRPGSRVVHERLGRHVLALQDDTASLDEVIVVSGRAKGQLPVLRVLAEQWRDDVAGGRPRDAHRHLRLDEVLDKLLAAGVDRTSDVESVRRIINRLRSGIAQAYVNATGIVIDDDAVIEGGDGYGYRINAQNVTVDL